MEEISDFSLENKSDTDSELLFKRTPCTKRIAGLVLEKQYQLPTGYYLIITSDDCPFEEGLHITLLDTQLNVIDRIDLGIPYAAALFENASITSEASLEFDFFPGTRYELSIETNGQRLYSSKLSEVTHNNSLMHKRYILIKRIA